MSANTEDCDNGSTGILLVVSCNWVVISDKYDDLNGNWVDVSSDVSVNDPGNLPVDVPGVPDIFIDVLVLGDLPNKWTDCPDNGIDVPSVLLDNVPDVWTDVPGTLSDNCTGTLRRRADPLGRTVKIKGFLKLCCF